MSITPVHHRLPQAGIDPITDASTALLTLSVAIRRPLRHETIALLLDDRRCGLAVVVVSGTEPPDAVLEVVEFLADPNAHGGRLAALVVASVRPAGRDLDDVSVRRDIDRWLEMSDIAEQSGVEVVEWFVVGADVTCPRDDLGEPPRW
jgi:hypothetical protein